MATKSLVFTLIGHDRSASKAIKGVERSSTSMAKNFVRTGALIAGGLAAAGVARWAADSIKALARWQEINAQSAAVVKSTGGAANITAGQVHKLAQRVEALTATEAETIQSGANMLLTFKNIRNETGKGNDIFDQATVALVDLSIAMDQDMKTSAIQLGKALNDPTRGLTALRRVGIQFTKQQEDQIKALQASGDMMGAQKIILKELQSQFGGSGAAKASTFTGKMFLLRDALGDVGEKIFKGVMPGLGRLADKGTELLNDFADSEAIGKITTFFNKWAGKIAAATEAMVDLIKQNPKKFFRDIMEALGPVALIWAIFNPGLALAAGLMGGAAFNAKKLKKPLEDFWAALEPLIPDLIKIVEELLPPLIKLLTDLVPVIKNELPFLKQLAEKVAEATEKWTGFLGVMSDFSDESVPKQKVALKALDGAYGKHVQEIAKFAWKVATFLWKWASDVKKVKEAVVKRFQELTSWMSAIPQRILAKFVGAGTWLYAKGKAVVQGFWNGLTYVWRKITSWVAGIAPWIKKHKGPISLDRGLLVPAGRAIMGGFWSGLKEMWAPTEKWVGGVGRRVASGVGQWSGLVSRALSMLGQPQSLLPAVLRRINLESGGNPRAINLWDSNFKAGIPSKGLMQTIDPTFNAYAGPFRGRGVYDPFANIYAGLNYALSRYGSISAIDPLRRPYGYAMGGTVGASGSYMVGERGPERVVLPRGSKVIPNHRLAGGGVNVIIQSKGGIDLSRYIEVKIEQADQAAARRIRQG